MAIANTSVSSQALQQQLKIRGGHPSQLDDVVNNKIKLAIEGMMSMLATVGKKSDGTRMGGSSSSSCKPLPLKKRPFSKTHYLSSHPCSKRQRIVLALTDDVLDEAADEVSEVSEWELILADWNTEQENLPFSLLDSTLVESL